MEETSMEKEIVWSGYCAGLGQPIVGYQIFKYDEFSRLINAMIRVCGEDNAIERKCVEKPPLGKLRTKE
jgi:hypothetical protein